MASDEQDKDTGETGATPPAAPSEEKTHISDAPTQGVPRGTQIIGTYEIADMIAAGGMGEVYRGVNIHTNQSVAIKIVLDDMAEDETILSLFRREATILGDLNHEAIVRYHIFTKDPILKRACLVMEFVEGRPLGDVLAEGPLSERDVHTLLSRLAPGLQKAHDLGVVHRDLSPDNIIVQDGMISHAKIIDFGIAKSGTETKHGKTVLGDRFAGKYGYVAPEQLFLYKGIVTGKSDIYALGLVAVAALQGRPLDMGDSMPDAMDKRSSVPDLSSVPEGMRPLLTWILQPDPANRPDSMMQLAAALQDPGLIPALDVQEGPSEPAPAPAPASPVSSQPPTGWSFDESGQTQPPTKMPSQPPQPTSMPPAPGGVAPPSGSLSAPPSDPFRSASNPNATQIAMPGAPIPTMPPGPGAQSPVSQPPVSMPPQAATTPPSSEIPPSSRGDEDSPFGGAPAAAPQPAPAAPPREEKKKSSALLPILGLLLVAGGGGGAYMAGLFDGGDATPPAQEQVAAVTPPPTPTPPSAPEPTEPEPQQPAPTPAPEEPAAPPTPQPSLAAIGTDVLQGTVFEPVPPAPEPEAPEGCSSDLECVAQMVTWLENYEMPSCTHVDVVSASADSLDMVAYAKEIPPIEALLADFEAAHTVEPDIGLRLVDERQCPAVDFLSAVGAGQGSAPVLRLDRDRVEYGGAIRGTITELGDRELWLIMVDQSGRFYNLTGLASELGNGARRFALQLSGGASNTDATPQIMIALASERPLDAIGTNTSRFAEIAPAVQAEIARGDNAVNLGAAYFRFEVQQ